MNKEELAKLLDGRDYRVELTDAEEKKAKAAGLVVVFGASDDLMEFRGAIHDEFGCGDEGDALVDAKGLLPERDQIEEDDELEKYFARKKTATKITGYFAKEGAAATWTYKTSIPHAKFKIMEDGEAYCQGIVFSLSDLGKTAPKKSKSSSRKNRPSPSDSATLYEEGFEMKGNDGNMYVISVASNLVKRWVKKK
jgi:hypothetical protein